MAKPRLFVSSTYYDLKSIREDIDRFIVSIGCEPIRHERGHISYGHEGRPEDYAYREIEFSDILVSVIGGRFGTVATDSEYSISQQELRRALELGKQVYIFVERSVLSEFQYYKTNKDVSGVRYNAVNDVRVYSFLDEIHLLPRGNPIFPFDTGGDIVAILRDQLAGLFQRLLAQESNRTQTSLVEELQRSLQTVNQLVQFLNEQNSKGEQAVQEILFSNHPIFDALRKVTRNKYRIYFTNITELSQWLSEAKRFTELEDRLWDSQEYMEWSRDIPKRDRGKQEYEILWVKQDLFAADGSLKPNPTLVWDDAWVRLERREISESPDPPWDDDIPF